MRRVGPYRKAACRSCNAPIWWVESRAGKNIPIDEHDELDEHIECLGLTSDEKPILQDLWDVVGRSNVVAHFTTCPDADEHRRAHS